MKIKGIFFLATLLFTLMGLHTINGFARHPLVYDGNIFFNDISNLVIKEYLDIIKFVLLAYFSYKIIDISASKIFTLNSIIFNNIKKSYYDIYESIRLKLSRENIVVLLFFIAILYKLVLYQFDLDFGSRGSSVIERFYYGNEFNVYKAYTFIAGSLSTITDNFNYYLSILNIVLGSATISIWYLIAAKLKGYSFNEVILCLLILLYIPLTAAETILRTELLYIFILSLSVLITINLTVKYSLKNIFLLNIVLLISCFVREQTIYLLPLYILFLFISIEKKYYLKSIFSISFTVILTSSLISNHNTDKYGFDSLFRDRVLIQKIMQYGYLDDHTRLTYTDSLSPKAKLLLNDITDIYQTNLLPSRREVFKDSYGLPESWKLIRPHHQNIYQKTNLSTNIYKKDITEIQNLVINLLQKSSNKHRDYNSIEITNLIDSLYTSISNPDQIRLLRDIQYIISNDFYYENAGYLDAFKLYSIKRSKNCANRGASFDYDRVWNIHPSSEIYKLYSKQRYSADCLINVTSRINYNYLISQRTNDYYHIAAQKIAPSFNHESQRYEYHPHLSYIKEIVFSKPLLYFTQSIIVGTSQTGYVPVPSGMSTRFANIYVNSIYPDFLLIDFQKLYYIFINFWYVFCFFSLILSFFIHNGQARNISLFLSVFPLYYGAFMAFASYAEFVRLMLPIIPFILYCSFFVLSSIYKMILTDFYRKQS